MDCTYVVNDRESNVVWNSKLFLILVFILASTTSETGFPSPTRQVIDASGKSSWAKRGEAARRRSRMQAECSHRKQRSNPSGFSDDN